MIVKQSLALVNRLQSMDKRRMPPCKLLRALFGDWTAGNQQDTFQGIQWHRFCIWQQAQWHLPQDRPCKLDPSVSKEADDCTGLQ